MTKDKLDKKTKDQLDHSRITDAVLMVSPDSFGFNHETSFTNLFQNQIEVSEKEIRNHALLEFNQVVEILRAENINVFVSPSRKDIETPDAVFPNNWISTHEGNQIVIYPMLTKNRRSERQLSKVRDLLGFTAQTVVHDLSYFEEKGFFLEGTGSLILDRKRKVAFAAESPRTSIKVISVFCKTMAYEPVLFHATDHNGKPIYHTNIVMSIGDGFAVICLEAVENDQERKIVINKIEQLGLEKIEITRDQMRNFCGNILELKSKNGQNKIVVSQTALDAFSKKQKEALQKYAKFVPISIPTIEKVGGGSARCILTEIFL